MIPLRARIPAVSVLVSVLFAVLTLAGCGGATPQDQTGSTIDAQGAAGPASGAVATPASPVAAPPSNPASSPAPSAVVPATLSGTYLRPFSATSPWNSRPIDPVPGTATVPDDAYKPTISSGSFSTSFYEATASDGPASFKTYNKDAEASQTVVLPHFPAAAVSDTGSDGHLDVLDDTTGIIHSFWQARKQADGTWTAVLYAWSRIDGSGFGDPAHYYQGARAAAVPTSAGIIRAQELNDGDDQYRHALAMSLTYSALSPVSPGYVFPATSADSDYTANTGHIPEGSLLMLPSTFDLSKISNAAIRKVAKTLMTYGAYVVDRNTGTPFVIYQEIGTTGIAGWRESADTEQIQRALRPVTATQFVSATGDTYTPSRKQNLISMRGQWNKSWAASIPGTFDTYANNYDFAASASWSEQNAWPQALPAWSVPRAGDAYVFTPHVTGSARMRLQVFVTENGKMVNKFDSGAAGTGSYRFLWPAGGYLVYVAYYDGGAAASASGTLVAE